MDEEYTSAEAFGKRPPAEQRTPEDLQQQTQQQTIVGQPGGVVAPNPFGNPGEALGNQINGGAPPSQDANSPSNDNDQ